MSNYYEAPDPTYCWTHGEDCEAEPMDSCPEFDGDPCNICDSPICHCDDDYERFRESQWED